MTTQNKMEAAIERDNAFYKKQLLPCPFCGGIPEHGMSQSDDGGCFLDRWEIACNICGVSMITMQESGWEWPHQVIEASVKNWNARANGWVYCSDAKIQEWAERHDINRGLRELRTIFEDAQTAHRLPEPAKMEDGWKMRERTQAQLVAQKEYKKSYNARRTAELTDLRAKLADATETLEQISLHVCDEFSTAQEIADECLDRIGRNNDDTV